MGLVLNPFAFRVGHSKSWSDSWYLISTEYAEFLHSSLFIKSFIYYVLYKYYPTRFSTWLVSHIEILFFNNTMYLWLYLYEASGKHKITKYIRMFRFGLFRAYRMRSYWFKKQIFDKNPIALATFNFLRVFRSGLERRHRSILSNYVFDRDKRDKISYLKNKYGRTWLGREEIIILKSVLRFFFYSANPYGLKYFSFFLKSLFVSPLKFYALRMSKIRSIRIILFFYSFMQSVIKTWPIHSINERGFVSKFIFSFLRKTVYWLFFVPFVNQLSRFIEYLCSWFGVSCVVRVCILTNFSLNALFIARYIMNAIKNGFNYLDIVFPIRKTLNSFMTLRIYNNFVTTREKIKKQHLSRVLSISEKKINVVLIILSYIRSELFFKYIYIYFTRCTYADDFIRNFYLRHYNSTMKHLYKGHVISRKKGFVKADIPFRRKFILKKRFFSSMTNKFRDKFYRIFENRLTAELLDSIRRAKRKPLSLAQKFKYNEKRRVKRAQERFEIEMAKLRETYSEVFERWKQMAMNIRFLRKMQFNKYYRIKKTKALIKRPRGIVFKMFYYTKHSFIDTESTGFKQSKQSKESKQFKQSKEFKQFKESKESKQFKEFKESKEFKQSKQPEGIPDITIIRHVKLGLIKIQPNYPVKLIFKIINFFFYIFITKFFKVIRLYYPLDLLFDNKISLDYHIWLLILYTINTRLLKFLSVFLKMRFIRKFFLELNDYFIYYYYIYNYRVKLFLLKRALISKNIFDSRSSLKMRKSLLNNKYKLIFKRTYTEKQSHTKRNSSKKVISPVDLLKSLVESGQASSYAFPQIEEEFTESLTAEDLERYFKKTPSSILKKAYDIKAEEHDELLRLKDLLMFMETNIENCYKSVSDIISNFSDSLDYSNISFNAKFFSLSIIKLYETFFYLLYIYAIFSEDHLFPTFVNYMLQLHLILKALFIILRNLNRLSLSNNPVVIKPFDSYMNIVMIGLNTLKRYIYMRREIYISTESKGQLVFNFILTFINYWKVAILNCNNSFRIYFFFLLQQISLNYAKIDSFDSPNIQSLIQFVDVFWFFGVNLFLKTHNGKRFFKFLGNFYVIFHIVIFIVRLLFSTSYRDISENVTFLSDYFYLLLPGVSVLPNFSKPYFLLVSLYNTPNIYRLSSVFSPSISDLGKFIKSRHFAYIIDLIEKKNFNFFYLGSFSDSNPFFPVNLTDYFVYVKELFRDSSRTFGIDVQFIANNLLPYGNKLVRVKSRDHIKSFLYGFKFHFVGRFTRKQQSASMWFRQGFLPSSSMGVDVDYGMFTLPLRFSACTVKVWLYRGVYVPKRTLMI